MSRCALAISLDGSLRSPKRHRAAAFVVARLDAGRDAAPRRCGDAQRAAFDRALAARRIRLLILQRLVHEGSRLVGAGHHAVAAADADVLVDEHDAVGALERGAGRADVHAGRVRRSAGTSPAAENAAPVLGSFTVTLRIHCASVSGCPVLSQPYASGAGGDAGRAAIRAFAGVDQKPPAHLRRRGRAAAAASRQGVERDAGREQRRRMRRRALAGKHACRHRSGSPSGHGRALLKMSRRAPPDLGKWRPCALWVFFAPGREAWHSKQSMETAA